MKMNQVSSSNIAAIGYDKESETVQVQFLNSAEYVYKGVPQREFDGLLNAPSVGSYFNRNFKNIYPYERIS